SGRFGYLSELGVELAGESKSDVQPGVLRPGRKAVGSRAAADLVERAPTKMGGRGCAGHQSGFAAEGSHGTVHHEPGRRGPLVCREPGGWPVPGALRAVRESDPEPTSSATIGESGGEEVRKTRRGL